MNLYEPFWNEEKYEKTEIYTASGHTKSGTTSPTTIFKGPFKYKRK
jgi:hypothetical protein